MDMRRTCRREHWYFGQGDDTFAIVDWFVAPPGARVYSDPTPFRSLDWWDGRSDLADRPGPVKYQLGTYLKGITPPGYLLPGMAQTPCGKADYWLDGIPSPPPPPTPLNPDGIPFCCTGQRVAVGTIAGNSSLNGVPPLQIVRQKQFALNALFDRVGISWAPPWTVQGDYLIAFLTATNADGPGNPVPIISGPGGWTKVVDITQDWINCTVWVVENAPSRHGDFYWVSTNVLFTEMQLYAYDLAYIPAGSLNLATSNQGDGSLSSIGPVSESFYPELVFAFASQYYSSSFNSSGGFAYDQFYSGFYEGSAVLTQLLYGPATLSLSLLLQQRFGSTYPAYPWTIILAGLRVFPPGTLPYSSIAGDSLLLAAAASTARGTIAGDSALAGDGASDVPAAGTIVGDSDAQMIAEFWYQAIGQVTGGSDLAGATLRARVGAGSISGGSDVAGSGLVEARATAFVLGSSAVSGAGSSSGGISLVPGQHGTNTGATAVSFTWPASTTAGNILLAIFASNKAGPPAATLTPPAGWSTGPTMTFATKERVTLYYYQNAPSQSSTGNFSTNGSGCSICCAEFAGLKTSGVADASSQNSGSSASADSGTTGTTAQASELWIGGFGAPSVTLSSPTNGFSILDQVSSAGGTALLYKIASATGAANTGATLSGSVSWAGLIQTLKGV